MSTGFQLRKLVVTGKNLEPAIVEFGPGLNVISGLSQTGKTYIAQCIDWSLGAGRVPKKIPEGQGYDKVQLEIEAADGRVFTFARALAGGGVSIIPDHWDSAAKGKPYASKHRKGASNTISHFLLDLMGATGASLKKNIRNELQELSYRTIAHLFVVDELRIIGEESPIRLEEVGASTSYVSGFSFVLTGQDDSALIAEPDPKTLRAMGAGRKSLLEGMVRELEQALESPAKDVVDADVLGKRLEELSVSVATSSAHIAARWQEREKHWAALKKVESRLVVLTELAKRYDLLSRHYDSDLSRLEFMSEGGALLEQLETIHCPVCGSLLDAHVKQGLCVGDASTTVSLENACAAEAQKIRSLKTDLAAARTDLDAETSELRARALGLAKSLEGVENVISGELEPVLAATRSEITALVAKRRDADLRELQKQRLDELRALLREESERKTPKERSKSNEHDDEVDTLAIRALCDNIESLLNSWHFQCKTVEFNQKTYDLLVDGLPRRSNGKGVRGLWHAAFSVALMLTARSRSGRHPGFLVLDSPLTTLREGQQGEVAEEVSGEMQQAFFANMARLDESYQLVVMENKEPSAGVRDLIRYTQFTGKHGLGRQGFFPKRAN